jgi:hypothetical protein
MRFLKKGFRKKPTSLLSIGTSRHLPLTFADDLVPVLNSLTLLVRKARAMARFPAMPRAMKVE